MLSVLILLLGLSSLSDAASVSSCGAAGDIFSNAIFSVSPDPIDKTKPLTITGTGTLTAAVLGGDLTVDLTVKALGIINVPISKKASFTASPGFAVGASKIVIGPFTLPSIPGTVTVAGKITASDPSGKEILCVALDLALVKESQVSNKSPTQDARGLLSALNATADPPVTTNCGTSADHLQNATITKDGKTTTVAGVLDEAVGVMTADIDLTVKVSFFSIPLKLTVPVSLSPALPKGPIKLSFTDTTSDELLQLKPSPTSLFAPLIDVKINGEVKAEDAKNEEITCIKITQA